MNGNDVCVYACVHVCVCVCVGCVCQALLGEAIDLATTR